MRIRSILVLVGLAFAGSLAAPQTADAQLLKRIKKSAENAVSNEADRKVDQLIGDAVACAFDDSQCVEDAEASGKPVVYTDADGAILEDSAGNPVTDRDQATEMASGPTAGAAPTGEATPGAEVWTNYDFVRGDKILFADDFTDDRVGNFPQRMEFVQGNMEVVEWQGRRFVQSTDDSQLLITLPDNLPEKFTIEFDYFQGKGHYTSSMMTDASLNKGAHNHRYPGALFVMGNQTGIGGSSKATLSSRSTKTAVTAIRIHVDGNYAKMYTDEVRVANVPNAVVPRGNQVSFRLWGQLESPAYLGNVVIAGGGRDLYDALSSEGRVATYGILFDTNSATLRPESGGTLRDIGEMLQKHADLRLLIEGHTDSEGADDHNLDLSARRAQSVVDHMVTAYVIDAGRLTAEGKGEGQPVADNSTATGRQQNRRVELVVN